MFLSNKITNKLIKKNISISVVESCTGGLLSSKITSTPGASKIFNLGLVTYSNKAKVNILKISSKLIKKNGAVSSETAIMMVKNLKKITKSKMCISITGIAGPSGGTKKKPIGLIYIGIILNKKLLIFQKNFTGSRILIQKKVVDFVFSKIDKLI